MEVEMPEVNDYEKYPVNDEEMGKRYKNWTESLAMQMMMLYKVGKEVGGEKFVERLKQEYKKQGKWAARAYMAATGTSKEDFKDCMNLPKIQDLMDDTYANYWNGYIENSPKAFEKEVYTCPAARSWSKEPELCAFCISELCAGMVEELNPRFKFKGFSKLMPKGEKACRFRVEMED
jgi:hypothetical protein